MMKRKGGLCGRAYIVGVLLQQLLAATSSGVARDLASDLRNPCDSYNEASC